MKIHEEHAQKVFRPSVVGVGASAGGLEALSQMVAGLPDDLGCAYVIAQHMSPNHRSMMAEILGRETKLPVSELVDGDTPQPNCIYIVPPGHNLVFRDGRFHLLTPSPEVSPKPSVNLLFQSIAECFDENAVAIVLSGTGSDGTVGLRAVKAAGGVTFAQSPESAKYDGMPHSAIDSGVVDHIVTPDRIGFELRRLILFPNLMTEIAGWEEKPPELAQIFEMVKAKTRIDFSSYKLSTVLRRLQRRLLATRSENLAGYLAYLNNHPAELEALARETLISVTEFFRDRDAFRALERQINAVVASKGPDDEIRVWSVGCATGEEAYSLAILFAEALGERLQRGKLQVFATDIDNDALAVARAGHYNAAALAEMPSNFLSKYFQLSEKEGRVYEPTKGLRDCVVFARQDIAVDPPFLRMDLIVCRNVLIYFNAELQARVLSVLHYALVDEGFLFLGRSETVTQQEELFSVADRRNRLYRPRKEKRSALASAVVRGRLATAPISLGAISGRADTNYERGFFQALAAQYCVAAMLVDGNTHILHSHGAVARFMEFPSGTPDMSLAKLIVPEFRQELLTTLHRARRTQAAARSRKRRLATHEGKSWRLAIFPAGVQRDTEVFLVNFEPGKVSDHDDDPTLPSDQTEQELAATREHLQTMLEEMASANEEMQALTEEVQAANEELQASNEELEATNEELQATNEELISVNEESLTKSAELAAVNADFESVHNTLLFPLLVFDAHLYAKRVNVTAYRAFGLPTTVSGQHITRLRLPEALQGIEERLANALLEQRPENYTVHHDGHDWRIYITPAANAAGTPQSVVLAIVDNTDLMEANRKTAESQEQLQSIMNHSVSLVALKEPSGRYAFVNQRFAELVGQSVTDILGKTDAQLFSQQTAQALRKGDLAAMTSLNSFDSTINVDFGARKIWLEAVHFPIFDGAGVVKYICTQANDISQKHRAEDQLRLAAKVFDRAGEAIVVTDPGNHIITVNAAFTQITGYAIDEAIGKTPSLLKSGRHSKDFYDAMWRSLKEQSWWQGEIFNRRKSGEIYPEWLTINTVLGSSGEVQNYVAIFSDISAIKSSQRRIEFMATHDELTGLPNRSLLMDRLKHSISLAQRQKKKLALLFIDLDNFKIINDTLGHDTGDILLKEATQRLQSCVRDSDTLARLGGDEFVALLMDVELEQINQIAGRIVDFLSASFRIRDKDLFVSASVGISIFPTDGDDSATLLKHADTAMYRAKERGRNQYQFFAEEMKVMALQRLTLETGLRQAIESDYFRLVYQPQVDLVTGEIVGAEALLRWQDPLLGEISPARFIPVAEGAGLINAIGDLVLDKALAQISDWRRRQLQPPRISINVSAHQMREVRFIDRLFSKLDAHAAPADLVCIELTESVLMEGIEITRKALERIEVAGMVISIDDFGTGYSSLSYLRQLPIHELKIDRSFVDGIADDGDDRPITTAIIQMARALGMKVVAEGVETATQADVLRSLGCDIAQGFFFHRPLEKEAFEQFLSKQGRL